MKIEIKAKLIEINGFLKILNKLDDRLLAIALIEGKIFEKEVIEQLIEVQNTIKLPQIQKIIDYLKDIRKKNHLSYQKTFYSEEFHNNVTKPLENMIALEKADWKKIKEYAKKSAEILEKETAGQTFKNRREKISGLLGKAIMGGGLLALVGFSGWQIYKALKKKNSH